MAAPETKPVSPGRENEPENEPFAVARRTMLYKQLYGRDISDHRVLAAMERVPRERFVPADLQSRAYEDCPLPIGFGQTISQPYIVALAAQLANLPIDGRALEIGAGSGYQAAVLARLCREVLAVEIIPALADAARRRLAAFGCANVTVRCGDGRPGWPERAPFDAIVVSAAPQRVPPALVDQLAGGGRLVIPVGREFQELLLIEKRPDGSLARRSVAPVQFVPLVGKEWANGKRLETD